MRIGFVGTGTMGTPIAGCLIRAGFSVVAYDRRPEAVADVCALGRGACRQRVRGGARERRGVHLAAWPRGVRGGDAGASGRGGGRAAGRGGAYRPDHQCPRGHRARGRGVPDARR